MLTTVSQFAINRLQAWGRSISTTKNAACCDDDVKQHMRNFCLVFHASPLGCILYQGKRSAGGVMIDLEKSLFAAAASLVLVCASAQSSNASETTCVRVTDAVFTTYPCDQTFFAFTMVGNTSVNANTVSLESEMVSRAP